MAIAQSMMRAALTTLVLSMIFASVGAANTPQTFLNVRNLQTIDVGTTLQQFVQGTSPFALRRMDKIHASMERSFQALPTNTDGLLSPPAVRYLVHNYFAQEHGWLINGLGSHSHNSAAPAAVHHADVLQSKAPEILEALLQAQHSRKGFSFHDALAMAATLERLIVDESAAMLEASYGTNRISVDEAVDRKGLRDVLMTFMLLFELGTSVNASDYALLSEMKENMEATIGTEDSFWDKLDDFQSGIVNNYLFEHQYIINPFRPHSFVFKTALELVERMFHSYGKWQNAECEQMKESLMELDQQGFGRVPLSTFYSQPETALYKFGESVEYLKETGALEETRGRQPHVLISNYLAGPSNCVAGSAFYSVCCLSECTRLMSELEGAIQAPSASPEFVVDLVSNISSSSIDAPRTLPTSLVTKLTEVAEQHGGLVPVHGRLFAQWMHYAFPLECQLPQNLKSDDVLSPAHWEVKGHTATPEEKERYLLLAADNAFLPVEAEDDMLATRWSQEEVLPFHGPTRHGVSFIFVGRSIAQMCLLVAVLRVTSKFWASTKRASEDPFAHEKAQYV